MLELVKQDASRDAIKTVKKQGIRQERQYVFAGRLTLFRKFEEALLTKFLEEGAYGKRKWY